MIISRDRPILDHASNHHRHKGVRDPLAHEEWQYIENKVLDQFTEDDWAKLDAQRSPYLAHEKAVQALEMLAAQKDAPTFGYEINNYEHCLQTATLAYQNGEDEETVVVALFHDLGFVTCNESHGEFSAALLRPYISDRNYWMLERHMYFQTIHCASHPRIDPMLRERWRGHEHFEYAARWVGLYDQTSILSTVENMPLSAFEPMVERIFSRPPKSSPIPE